MATEPASPLSFTPAEMMAAFPELPPQTQLEVMNTLLRQRVEELTKEVGDLRMRLNTLAVQRTAVPE